MRKSLLLVMGLLITMSAMNAQALAMLTPPVKGDKTERTVEKAAAKKFEFTVYGGIPVLESAFEEKHFLGNALSEKWNTFCRNYTRVYEVSVGLSGSAVEIAKPAVYNAVQKANKFYRKNVKSKKISKEEAILKLSHILDCANVICMENDTESFELAASEAKEPEQIIALFENVELKFL